MFNSSKMDMAYTTRPTKANEKIQSLFNITTTWNKTPDKGVFHIGRDGCQFVYADGRVKLYSCATLFQFLKDYLAGRLVAVDSIEWTENSTTVDLIKLAERYKLI